MADHRDDSLQAGPEQVLYAYILEKGMYFGLLFLILTFLLYVLGVISPYIPKADISRYWSLNVSDYLHTAKIEAGWAWLSMVGYGDFLNFVPIVILAGITIICFAAIVPLLWKEKDRVYACLAVLEVLILVLAASGILGSGGH
ncbi:MAG: hypothetical protein GX443_09175 [Deltaproteobacteria bacterium]|nr:hypothetical protein [Deltaproteobacteria bacterium]